MNVSPRPRQHWLIVFGFAFAAAAGCSVHVMSGVGPSEGGGGTGQYANGSGAADGSGAGNSSGGGAETGSGGHSCTTSPSCDCQTFCANTKRCYESNFEMSWCLQTCEDVPGDLRQCVCDAGDSCDAVAACGDQTWYGPGSCAVPFIDVGAPSLDECRLCWNHADAGACVIPYDTYASQIPTAALNIATCLDLRNYTTSAIITCEHKYPGGVEVWDALQQCSTCGVCASACAGTDVYNYVCGSDPP
jgi:hypothetical protein